MIIVGIITGIILTLIVTSIQHYLERNHLKLKWTNVFIALIAILFICWITYSSIGMIFGQTHSNGYKECTGYQYGLKICVGDINA